MLELEHKSLDNEDLVTIAQAATHSASNNTLSLGGLALVLSELNRYGQKHNMSYGSKAPVVEEEVDGV